MENSYEDGTTRVVWYKTIWLSFILSIYIDIWRGMWASEDDHEKGFGE